MSNEERKVIFTIIGIMVAILLILVIIKSGGNNKTENVEEREEKVAENGEKYVTTLSDGTKINNSSELNQTKTYKTISISGIQFTSKNGNSVLLAELTNTGDTTFAREVVTITILGEDGEIVDTIEGIIPETKAGETSELNVITTADLVNVKDFTITAK